MSTDPGTGPGTDPGLDAVLIGGRERVPIVLVEHDPGWAGRFAEIEQLIRSALGARALAVEHIGSTAVPGLVAKPIVDVLLTVADVAGEATWLPALEAAGLQLRVREPDHRMLRMPDRDVHVHVLAPGHPGVRAYLALRDRLRADAADRELYAARKRELAAREWADMNAYAEAKSDVVREILSRASGAAGGLARLDLPDGSVVVLRRAVAEDLPSLVRLLADDGIGASRESPDLAPYEAAFRAIEADPAQLLVVAVDGDDGGEIVGTLQLTVVPGLARGGALRGQLEAVRVASSRRGSGLGAALVGWAVEEARRRGCALVQLTTDKRRTDAHRFYKRLGFVASHEGLKRQL